jgi:hypothetical protein
MTEPEDKTPETEETEINELPEVVAHSEEEEEAACITNHGASISA